MNNKGFTLVEIIVSISLVSVVMIFLFQIITTIKNIYDKQNNKNDIKITVAVITREVERDLSSFGLVGVPTKTCDMTNNNIVPSTATNVKCIKLIYDGNNVKNNEGYIVYYQNNGKYFLGYKRGKDNIIETQTVREINVAPKEDIDIIIKENSDMKSLKITLPVRDNNDNYDLVINYMNTDNHVTPLEEYNVSVSAKNGELISVNGAGKYKKGEMVTINFTFDNNQYELVNVSCTNITCDKNQTISFTMPDSDVNIIVELKKKIGPKSFAEDSWEIIAANTSSDVYKVGDTKQVFIGNKSYTVRIANKSTPSECTREDFSQTACGFVVEFADIVENRQMNPTDTNVGGWPATEMRKYANNEFYNKLPAELRNVIIDTKVVSGHGNTSGEKNFESKDKIYLLSAHEVWEDGTSNRVSTYDTAYDNTRQLDYYKSKGVTTSNYSNAIKQYNSSNSRWWLRVAYSNYHNNFLGVIANGDWSNYLDTNPIGLAPAFRIGDKENTVTPKSFAKDTWETIAENTSSDVYKVGDTKQVLIGNKSYTVRIANKSTPSECTREDFSQTACGFVVEFADIVENRQMNNSFANLGGWPKTAMRTYANGEFYNKLSEELRKVIIETKVLSGHNEDKNANRTDGNWESTDKIYLLSSHEVREDGTSNQVSGGDTAYNQTRQLDYYANLGVTFDSCSGAIKKYNSSNSTWWLRTAHINGRGLFLGICDSGGWCQYADVKSYGFAPAFRIGLI